MILPVNEVWSVSVKELSCFINPYEMSPWPNTLNPLSKNIVLRKAKGIEGNPRYVEYLESGEKDVRSIHYRQVAWLYKFGWSTPIEVTLVDDCYPVITDGNHRFAAAILRGDERINFLATTNCLENSGLLKTIKYGEVSV